MYEEIRTWRNGDYHETTKEYNLFDDGNRHGLYRLLGVGISDGLS